MNSLLEELNQRGTKAVAYADDLVVWIEGKFPTTLTDLMQGALNTVQRWTNVNGLKANASKTELVLFTRK